LLERWGHRVDVADNGQIALQMLPQRHYDLVLMDMMMPVMDGLEATRRIRAGERGQRIPIIAMTANAMESDRNLCLAAGMDDYVSKPIRSEELQQKITELTFMASAKTGPADLRPETEVAVLAPQATRFDYAAALTQADQEMVDIVADVFCEQWEQDKVRLEADLAAGDFHGMLHAAHALKATLSLFEAQPASALAQRLESMAAFRDAAAVAALIPSLVREVESLVQALRQRAGSYGQNI
jgi:CheY-like chemotaxis protein